mgnify:CR=1 FL=1
MHVELLQKLGLAQNEARIYETLLKEGSSGVGHISATSQVHRRNVYDSLNRLLEKGLVFEIRSEHENRYQAVSPHKLSELLQEKQGALDKVMPELESLYEGKLDRQEVLIYRGIEGWKNYLRDLLRVGEDYYVIDAKAQISSPKLKGIADHFLEELKKKNINPYRIYNHQLRKPEYANHIKFLGSQYRFLPEKYSTSCTTAVFGDYVVFFSGNQMADFDENDTFTVILNKEIATAYKTWAKLFWEISEKPTKKK